MHEHVTIRLCLRTLPVHFCMLLCCCILIQYFAHQEPKTTTCSLVIAKIYLATLHQHRTYAGQTPVLNIPQIYTIPCVLFYRNSTVRVLPTNPVTPNPKTKTTFQAGLPPPANPPPANPRHLPSRPATTTSLQLDKIRRGNRRLNPHPALYSYGVS